MTAATRLRYTLVAGATAVVIGAGVTVAGLARQAGAGTAVPRSEQQPLAVATAPTDTGPSPVATATTPSASPSASPIGTPVPSATPTAPVSVRPTRTSTRPPVRPTRTRTTPAAEAPATDGDVVAQVLDHINAARRAEGLSALALDTKLSRAAALHTKLMIDGCGLSHQCPGEKGMGARFTAQDVRWSTAGENIGYGSSGSSAAAKVRAANGLTDRMLAEVPPDDGHRKNLLNKNFRRIGLSILRDGKGITWMTQDFVG